LLNSCGKLGIRNIRVIQSIRRLWEELLHSLEGREDLVITQAAESIVFFVWCRYGQNKEVPDLGFVKRMSPYRLLERDKPEQEKVWERALNAYGYSMTDDLDMELVRFVGNSYLDSLQFQAAVEKHHKEAVSVRGRTSHLEMWGLFRNSFDEDPDFPDKLAENFWRIWNFYMSRISSW
jgi:hypothetical protein